MRKDVLFLCFFICTFSVMIDNELFGGDSFFENIFIKPLPQDGKVVTVFNFTIISESNMKNHFQLFPKRFFQLINKHSVNSLNLTFAQGRWEYSKWGIDHFLNQIIAPSGVQLSTRFSKRKFGNNNQKELQKNWRSLVHGLSGLFCTSLNFLDLKSKSYASGIVFAESNSFYGTLSKESVCTENLTPVKSLIPTRNGIIELLNPLKLFDCFYYNMAVNYRRKGNQFHHLEVLVSVVFNMENNHKLGKYSFMKYFGRDLKESSPIAKESSLRIQVDSTEIFEKMNVTPMGKVIKDENGNFIVFNEITNFKKFSIGWKSEISVLKEREKLDTIKESLSPIVVHKFHTYSDQVYGKISIHFENFLNNDLEIDYFDAIPWYFKVYTNSFHLNNKVFHNFSFTPFHSFFGIMFKITLPKNSVSKVYFDVENSFLANNEHPPDASRGFDLSSSVIKYTLNDKCYNYFTESLLITIPIPDFSMPFNVMMISSTFISLFFVTMTSLFLKRRKWKLKLHLLEIISQLDKNKFQFNKDFILSKNEELMNLLIKLHFKTALIYKSRHITGELLFRKYYNSSVKKMLSYFSKSINKFVNISNEYSHVNNNNVVDLDEMKSRILNVMKGRISKIQKIKPKSKMNIIIGKLKNVLTLILNKILFKNEFDSFLSMKTYVNYLPLDIQIEMKKFNTQ